MLNHTMCITPAFSPSVAMTGEQVEREFVGMVADQFETTAGLVELYRALQARVESLELEVKLLTSSKGTSLPKPQDVPGQLTLADMLKRPMCPCMQCGDENAQDFVGIGRLCANCFSERFATAKHEEVMR